jgi:hypothetical protein
MQVNWDSPEDPKNPKNWSMKRKWAATFIVSAFTLVSPISSSMIAPALGSIKKDFNITNEVEAFLTLSIFVLAYAIGPLFLGPLSEIYGRVVVLQTANLFFLAWNIGCGFAQSSGQLMAFRFLSGLGGSAPLSIGGVSITTDFLILRHLANADVRPFSVIASCPNNVEKPSPSIVSRPFSVPPLVPSQAGSSAKTPPGAGVSTQPASLPQWYK